MVHYSDPAFNKDFSSHYTLLFQLEEQQYSYAVYDKRKGTLQVLKTVGFNTANHADGISRLKVSLTSDDILQAPFGEIKLALTDVAFTLVPRVLFEEAHAAAYLSMHAPLAPEDQVMVNQVRGVFIRNVFSVPGWAHNYFQDLFHAPKFFHVGTALLETATRNRDQFADQHLILDIKPGMLYILYYEKKEFMYMNSFRFVNKDDFLYYVLLIAEEYALDRESCQLALSGEIIPDAQLYDELWKFFRNIQFVTAHEHIRLPEELQEKPMHMFNSLLSLDLCE